MLYEYSTLPNSWEVESLTWDHYYAESYLGSANIVTSVEFDAMSISVAEHVAVMEIEVEQEQAKLPPEVYEVYVRRHFEGRELPCQLLN